MLRGSPGHTGASWRCSGEQDHLWTHPTASTNHQIPARKPSRWLQPQPNDYSHGKNPRRDPPGEACHPSSVIVRGKDRTFVFSLTANFGETDSIAIENQNRGCCDLCGSQGRFSWRIFELRSAQAEVNYFEGKPG